MLENLFALFCSAFAGSAVITRLVTGHLLRQAALCYPQDRSVHKIPRPVGGGWGVVPVVIVMLLVAGYGFKVPLFYYAVIVGSLLLTILSWYDDLYSLSARIRFTVQGAVVAGCLYAAPESWAVLDGYLPLWADRALTGIAWLWFINLYNFMDGIDGLTGIETGMLGIGGAALLMMTIAPDPFLVRAGWIIGGAGFGFLVWNWHPARVFIGDTGSIPLGFLMGWFLLSMAVNDLFWAAVLISLYYCMDASYTIITRMRNGRKFWKADQSYAFQQAVIKGYDHDQVVKMIILLNIFLLACAFLATFALSPVVIPFVIFLAGGMTAAIMAHFHGRIDIGRVFARKK